MGDAGAEALAEAVLENHTLREIDLGGNRIRDRGAEAWAAALEGNWTLQTLKVILACCCCCCCCFKCDDQAEGALLGFIIG